MNGRRLWSWLLVGVAIFVVLGHICAAPIHAHAGAVTTHSEDHPESGSDEAAHGGFFGALSAPPQLWEPPLLHNRTFTPRLTSYTDTTFYNQLRSRRDHSLRP